MCRLFQMLLNTLIIS